MNKYIKKICEEIFEFNKFEEFKNKTILITGANGLIGGMFADYFSYLNDIKNYNINLILCSYKDISNLKRINHLVNKDYVQYVNVDLTKNCNWSNFILTKVDFCFYSAGYATPKKFIENPIGSILVNTVGVYDILDFIYENNKNCKFTYISSAEVYSNSFNKIHSETDDLIVNLENKRNFYKLGKISGELLINEYIKQGLLGKSIRTSVCYGPGVLGDDNRVISDLTRKGLTENNIQLLDGGLSTRKYLHISDFCKMVFNITHYGTKNVYNTCGNEEKTVLEIAQYISNITNKKIILGSTNNVISKYAPEDVSLSLENYKKDFGNHIFKTTKEGIEDFVNWYKKIIF